MPSEKRLSTRYTLNRPIQVRWVEECGRERTTDVTCVDVGRRGMSIITTERLRAGSQVYLRLKDLQLLGTALVRYQQDEHGVYHTGLEFLGGLLMPKEVLSQLTPVGVE